MNELKERLTEIVRVITGDLEFNESCASDFLYGINDAGYQIVPKEPTEAMKEVAETVMWNYGGMGENIIPLYKAMLEAAKEGTSA